MTTDKNILGTRIIEQMNRHGLSQREIADKVGVTEVSMSRYIKGDRVPKGTVIACMARVLCTTSDYLLGNDMDDSDPEIEYYRTQRAIARNARLWTNKQKADLVIALFEDGH